MKNITIHIILIISFILIAGKISHISAQQKSCADCHKSLIEKKTVHAAADDCSACHTKTDKPHPYAGQKGFELSDKFPEICYACHEQKNTKANVHMPVSEGDCKLCHNPHSSDNPALLTEKKTATICAKCHENNDSNLEIQHKPFAAGDCQKCHDPHQSDNNTFLLLPKPDLCFSCHEKKSKQLNLSEIHPPFADNCATCHKPHAAQNNDLLVHSTKELCLSCHEAVYDLKNSKSIHGIIESETSCSACHSPHASEFKLFLRAQGNDLCLKCHNSEITSEKRIIENIFAKINYGKSVHAPAVDNCATCHIAHSSENAFLLNAFYSEKKYLDSKAENFELCFNCHDKDIIYEKQSFTVTQFHSSGKNLHYAHINGSKGRNCNLCHDIHGSQNLHLIKENVVFGNWKMNMNYSANDNGGSCFPGCHGEKKYTR